VHCEIFLELSWICWVTAGHVEALAGKKVIGTAAGIGTPRYGPRKESSSPLGREAMGLGHGGTQNEYLPRLVEGHME